MKKSTYIIKDKSDVEDKILSTLENITGVVSNTMGPGGSNILINTEHGTKITKDGISCLMSINPECNAENAILDIVKDSCFKTNKNVGDGTTGTAVLLAEIVKRGLFTLKNSNINPLKFRDGLMLAADEISDMLKKLSKPIKNIKNKAGLEQLHNVAKISTNNDLELAKIISDIFKTNGESANIKLEMSNTSDTSYEIVDGFQLDRGYLSQYFADDTGVIEFEYPNIFISEKNVNSVSELTPIINYHVQTDTPFIIIAPKFDVTVLNALILYKMRGLKVCCILYHEFGVNTNDVLEDIAIQTGAKIISDLTNISFRQTEFTTMPSKEPMHITGSAKTVTITENKTTIIDGNGDPTQIHNRIEYIKSKIEQSENDYTTKEYLEKRLDNLTGGVAVIRIGGNTAARTRERYDLAEDAINSCKAAIKSGVLPGAGSTLAQINKSLLHHNDIDKKILNDFGNNSGEYLGFITLFDCCSVIFNKVVENALDEQSKYEFNSVLNELKTFEFKTFDLKNKTFDDALILGIIDPTEVVQNQVINAAEGAGIMLTLNSIIVKNKNNDNTNIAELITKM